MSARSSRPVPPTAGPSQCRTPPATGADRLRARDSAPRCATRIGPRTGSTPRPPRSSPTRSPISAQCAPLRRAPSPRATAYVAAAHTYRLFLEGQQVDFGPGFCFPDEQYFRTVDVTAHLRPGRPNCVGVLQRWYGGGKGRPVSASGLLFQLDVHYADGRQVHPWDGRLVEGAPGRVASFTPAQYRGVRLRRMGGRARPPAGLGHHGFRRHGNGHRPRCADRWAPLPSPSSSPSAPTWKSTWSDRSAGASCRTDRWSSTSGPSIPPGFACASPRRRRAGPFLCTSGTCSTPTERCPPPTGPRPPTSRSPTSPAPVPRSSRP